MCICTYVCMLACLRARVYLCACLSECLYLCVCVWECVCQGVRLHVLGASVYVWASKCFACMNLCR